MYARKVSQTLKPNSAKDFTAKLDSDVIPLLRKQKGFQDEITFTDKDHKKVIGISLWDRKESADSYHRDAYPQVRKMLEHLTDGMAQVETYEVSNSTLHNAPVSNSK